MKNKINWVHCFIICLVVTLVWLPTACKPDTPTEGMPVSQTFLPTKTTEPTQVITKSTPTITTSTATATPSITPSPTLPPLPLPTNTVIPTPMISHMQKLGELPIGGIAFPNLGVSADGTLLAVSAGDVEDVLYVFDMITQTVQWEIIEDDTGGTVGYSSLAFSPDNRYLAGWDGGFSLFVWDMYNGEVVYQIRYERDWEVNIRSVSFSPDSQLLVLSSLNLVEIYSMATGDLVDRFPSQSIMTYPPTENGDHFLKPGHHYGQTMGVEFVPNQINLLAITIYPDPFVEGEGITGGLYFWDMEAHRLESIMTGEGGYQMLISPSGQILVARIDKQLVGWNIPNNREIFTIDSIEGSASLVTITDIGFFATFSHTGGVNIWDFGGELVATLNPDVPAGDAVFLPDGRLLIAYLDENSPIEIWEITE
ncbi:MAG: hypothetical protein H6667_24995 [Ardenticatenaceae bacterium]|nr:hypothetical protein [Ardenticatenaceae bacterium]MCB9445262.1 hypothetical protein [Ardenticatenaceae bacterium]